MEKNKLEYKITPYTEVNSRLIKYLHINDKTLKLLIEVMREL
jgi:hypothetical protein